MTTPTPTHTTTTVSPDDLAHLPYIRITLDSVTYNAPVDTSNPTA